jgi:hypothetical protein
LFSGWHVRIDDRKREKEISQGDELKAISQPLMRDRGFRGLD